jgi:hypothetical protein
VSEIRQGIDGSAFGLLLVPPGKSITLIALRLKRTVTAVRGRLSILKISLRKVKLGLKAKANK